MLLQKDDDLDMDELIKRMDIDFQRDLQVQERGVNGRSYEALQQYVAWLEAGEVSREEHRRLVENYLAAQSLRCT